MKVYLFLVLIAIVVGAVGWTAYRIYRRDYAGPLDIRMIGWADPIAESTYKIVHGFEGRNKKALCENVRDLQADVSRFLVKTQTQQLVENSFPWQLRKRVEHLNQGPEIPVLTEFCQSPTPPDWNSVRSSVVEICLYGTVADVILNCKL